MKPADRRWYRDGRYAYEVDAANNGYVAATARVWGREPVRCSFVLPFFGQRCEGDAGHPGLHSAGNLSGEIVIMELESVDK